MLGQEESDFYGYYCNKKYAKSDMFNLPYWHFRKNGTFIFRDLNIQFCRIEGTWEYYCGYIQLEGDCYTDMVSTVSRKKYFKKFSFVEWYTKVLKMPKEEEPPFYYTLLDQKEK